MSTQPDIISIVPEEPAPPTEEQIEEAIRVLERAKAPESSTNNIRNHFRQKAYEPVAERFRAARSCFGYLTLIGGEPKLVMRKSYDSKEEVLAEFTKLGLSPEENWKKSSYMKDGTDPYTIYELTCMDEFEGMPVKYVFSYERAGLPGPNCRVQTTTYSSIVCDVIAPE